MNRETLLAGHPVFDRQILTGFHLLEADAGTGKTWTIAGLVVRALVERALEIDQILVVSFTRAATAELAARVRDRLVAMIALLQARLDGTDSPIEEIFCDAYADWLERHGFDLDDVLTRLRVALSRIDEAVVRTIDGFCRQVVDDYGSLLGLATSIELGSNELEWIDPLVYEWWRREVVNGSPEVLRLLDTFWISPVQLAEAVRAIQRHPHAWRSPALLDIAALANELQRLRDRLHVALREESAQLVQWLATKGNVNRNKYRSDHVRAWCEELRAWAAGALRAQHPSPSKWPIPQHLARFSSSGLREHGAATSDAPTSIPAISEALNQLFQRSVDLLGSLAQAVWTSSAERRAQRLAGAHPIGFEELLGLVEAALHSPPTGPRLARALRERYPFALVDECQDTDPRQWSIFARLYVDLADADARSGLILVGDPKQAIYAFRGADVYSYLDARLRGPRAHGLHENQRAVQGLIDAVNAVFGVDQAFGIEGIEFAQGKLGTRARQVLIDPDHSRRPLTVLRCGRQQQAEAGEQASASMTKGEATALAVETTAAEIARLLTGGVKLDGRALAAEDIAVLVFSHREASKVKRALARRGIGAAEVSRSSVTRSMQAIELGRWLLAMADPTDPSLIRAALITSLGGFDADALTALAADARSWNRWVEHFAEAAAQWPRVGAHAAMRRLFFDVLLPQRLAVLSDGERRLTNVLHLLELIAGSAEASQGPAQAARWLDRVAGSDDSSDSEARELRLDSDARLVRVLTVHKSKGLEFPVVFLPFLWGQGSAARQSVGRLYHVRGGGAGSRDRSATGWSSVLDLRHPADEDSQRKVADERRAESMRLLYVALTRASNRCYLVWIDDAVGKTLPPLGTLIARLDPDSVEEDDPFERWQRDAGEGSVGIIEASAVRDQDVGQWADESSTLDPSPSTLDPSVLASDLTARTFDARIPSAWTLSSFSSLAARRAAAQPALRIGTELPALPDHDAVDEGEVDTGLAKTEAGAVPADDSPDADVRARFPAGARAGACLHAILEDADFRLPLADTAVTSQLVRAGYTQVDASAVAGWIDSVIDRPMRAPDGAAVMLRGLAPADYRRELDFFLPVRNLDESELFRAVAAEYPLDVPVAGGRLQGFLRGFIDLMFRRDGKWYVLDWKSNRLAPAATGYTNEVVLTAMREHAYSLQACLYLLILHRFLRGQIPDYDWDRDVGGAFWVFLRAAGTTVASHEETSGVHASKPSRELIERMDRLFDGGRTAA